MEPSLSRLSLRLPAKQAQEQVQHKVKTVGQSRAGGSQAGSCAATRMVTDDKGSSHHSLSPHLPSASCCAKHPLHGGWRPREVGTILRPFNR